MRNGNREKLHRLMQELRAVSKALRRAQRAVDSYAKYGTQLPALSDRAEELLRQIQPLTDELMKEALTRPVPDFRERDGGPPCPTQR